MKKLTVNYIKVILKKARDNLSCCCICANKRSYTNHCPATVRQLSGLWTELIDYIDIVARFGG